MVRQVTSPTGPPGPVGRERSGLRQGSRSYDVSIKFIRQGLLFLRKTFYLVTNFGAFGKEEASFRMRK